MIYRDVFFTFPLFTTSIEKTGHMIDVTSLKHCVLNPLGFQIR